MNFTIHPAFVLALAVLSAMLLGLKMLAARRANKPGKRHRWLFILGAVIVRLYVIGVYVLFTLSAVDAETRSTLGRQVVVFWLAYEVISNLVQWAMGEGPGERKAGE